MKTGEPNEGGAGESQVTHKDTYDTEKEEVSGSDTE